MKITDERGRTRTVPRSTPQEIWGMVFAVVLALLFGLLMARVAAAEPPAGVDAVQQGLVDVYGAVGALDCPELPSCPEPEPCMECPPGHHLECVEDEPPPPPGLPVPVGVQIWAGDFTQHYAAGDAEPQLRAAGYGWTAIQQGLFRFAQHPLGGLVLGSAVNPTTSQAGKAMSTVELVGARGPVGPGDVVTARAVYYFGGDQRITRVTVFDLEDSGTSGNDGLRYQLEDATVVLDRTKLRLRGMQTNFTTDATVPKGRWFTLTWEVTVGEGFDGRSRAWLDGELVQDLNVQTTRAGLQFDRLQFGLTARLREYGPLEMWTRELGVWWQDN